jgi:hypothetical protein
MAKQESPDVMLKKVFVVTMLGAFLFIATVFVFIL